MRVILSQLFQNRQIHICFQNSDTTSSCEFYTEQRKKYKKIHGRPVQSVQSRIENRFVGTLQNRRGRSNSGVLKADLQLVAFKQVALSGRPAVRRFWREALRCMGKILYLYAVMQSASSVRDKREYLA
jgi:hypothetical protein